MNSGAVCFTGRFQPFHRQHFEVVEEICQNFAQVIIGITNPDLEKLNAHVDSTHRHTDQANPFDYGARKKIVLASLGEATNIEVIPFDLDAPESWQVPAETTFAIRIFSPWEISKKELFAANGFATVLLTPPQQKLSASSIREQLVDGDECWKEQVLLSAVDEINHAWQNSNVTSISGKA